MRATPAVIRFSRSINPICTASLTKPPSELKKIGRYVRFAKTAKNSRNRWAAPLIKSALPGDPLGAATTAGVWLTRGNDKNQWLASDLCE